MRSKDFKCVCRKWAATSFKEAFKKHACKYPKKVRNTMQKLLRAEFVALANKPMTGWSFEDLPRTQEGATYKIRFSDAYDCIVKQKESDPMLYMLELIKRVLVKYPTKPDSQKISGYLARALRSFTSFIRESTFEHDIRPILEEVDKRTVITSGPDIDAKDHTDIHVVFRKCTYRLWIYQYSNNGIPHDMERVAGLRGVLPPGRHILCPLKSEPARHLGKIKKQILKNQQRNIKLNQDLTRAKNGTKKRQKLLEQLQKNENAAQLKTREQTDIEQSIKDNLEEVCGFFFYSGAFIRSVTSAIILNTKPIPYEEVRRIMIAPRELLGLLTSFEVS
jgi:hypothetical protein